MLECYVFNHKKGGHANKKHIERFILSIAESEWLESFFSMLFVLNQV